MNKNFAVCILSYNREEYLDKTIGSFKKINFPSNKIFIYDDLSNFSKNRAKILKKYNQYNFIINYKRLGLSKNISNILKLKKYDYVLLFEDHDLIHRDYFKEINKIIEINPDLSFIVTERLYIDKNDNLIKKSKPNYFGFTDGNKYIKNELSKFNFSHPLCVAIKGSNINKKIINKINNFWVYGDIYLWLSLAKNRKIYFHNKHLYYSRVRESDHFLDTLEKNMKTIKEISKIHKIYMKENPEFNLYILKFKFEIRKIIKIIFNLVSYRIKSKNKIKLKYGILVNLLSAILNILPLFLLIKLKK